MCGVSLHRCIQCGNSLYGIFQYRRSLHRCGRFRLLQDRVLRYSLEKLEENLDEMQKAIFEEYKQHMDKYFVATGEQAFCDGFSLDAKILTEALNGAEQII